MSDFTVDQRVEFHPATDLWMMGARFGTVVKIGRKYVHVLADRTGRVHKATPDNLLFVD